MTMEEYEKERQVKKLQLQEEQDKLLRQLFKIQDQLKKTFPKYEELYVEAQEISNKLFDLEMNKKNAPESQKSQYECQQKSLATKLKKVLKEKEKVAKLTRELQEQEETLKERLRDIEIKKRAETYGIEPEL